MRDSDPDPDVRAQAEVELLDLQPPVAGMFIQQIVPNSQAQALGLRRGDIILQYNGQPYASLNAPADADRQIASQEQVPLRVYRRSVLDSPHRLGLTSPPPPARRPARRAAPASQGGGRRELVTLGMDI